MSSHHTRLWLILGVVIIGLFIIVVMQIKKTSSISTKVDDQPIISPGAMDLPVTSTDPLLGNPGAPLTVVAYLDFGDKQSRDYYKTIADLTTKNPTKARFYFKDYPAEHLFSHSNIVAHQAAFCAGKYQKFWDFANQLVTSGKTDEKTLRKIATDLKLPVDLWWTCTQSSEAQDIVASDVIAGRQLGIPGAPTVFVNNHALSNNPDFNLAGLLQTFVQ